MFPTEPAATTTDDIGLIWLKNQALTRKVSET
jgi:hypothetical protein